MLVDSGATVSNLTIGGASNSTDPAGLVVVSPGAVLSNVSVGWRGRVEIKGLAYQPGSKITVNRGVLRVAILMGPAGRLPLRGRTRRRTSMSKRIAMAAPTSFTTIVFLQGQ